MKGLNALRVILFALVAINYCYGQNNTGSDAEGQNTDVTDGEPEKSALEKGMDPVFKMYHNFLDTVMSTDFYSSQDSAFDVNDLIRIVKEEDYGYIQKNWKDVTKTFGGYAGCIIVGLLFVLFMPIVGLIYCCCHCCCHKCGGTREQKDPKYAPCKRWTVTICLLICTTFMLAGAIITFLGSELFHRALSNEDQTSFVNRVDNSIGHLQDYTNTSITDLQDAIQDRAIHNGIDVILPLISSAVDNTVSRIKDTINATSVLNEAENLGAVAVQANIDLKNVSDSLTRLTDLQENVTTVLTKVKNDVAASCPTSPQCPDMSSLELNVNFTKLGKLEAEANKIRQATNISRDVQKAAEEFDTVSSKVNTTIGNVITDAKTEVSKVNKTIIDMLDTIGKNFTDNILKEFQSGRDSFRNGDTNKQIKQIGDYIWYACIGIACAVLLVVFFYYLGVLFGLCGERPSDRANCCNRGTGASLLCTGICCSFLFAWLLMLLVILMFALGGLTYSLGCKYLLDGVENVQKFEAVIEDGFGFNLSETVDIEGFSISGVLTSCKANEPLYTALQLEKRFNIDKELNITSITGEVTKITDQTVTLNDITLLTQDLTDQLNDFKNSNLNNVIYSEYTDELDKQVLAVDLSQLITSLRTASTSLSKPELSTSADELQALQTNQLADIQAEKDTLRTAINNLEAHAKEAAVPAKVDSLIASITNSQNQFNTQKDNITKEELKKVADTLAEFIETTFNSTIAFVKAFAPCRKLYDFVQGLSDAVCIVTLDPLNSIWFGLGWCLFFYIPCFILAVMLSSLYKRSQPWEKEEPGFDSIRRPYNGYDDGYARHDDHIPLTQVKDNPRSTNGAYNQGYQGRDYEPRYHRDDYSRHSNDPYERPSSGGHKAMYAQPHDPPHSPYESPPHYDDAVSARYSHGGRSSRPYHY